MNKIDNIKELYEQIDKKTKFIALVASELKNPNTGESLNPQYARGHYFSAFWSIPERNQDRIIELAQNTIANQKQTA